MVIDDKLCWKLSNCSQPKMALNVKTPICFYLAEVNCFSHDIGQACGSHEWMWYAQIFTCLCMIFSLILLIDLTNYAMDY